MRLCFLLFILALYCVIRTTYSQNCATAQDKEKKGQNVRIIFYNLENLYDTKDDSTKTDEEFTPAGTRHWIYSRMAEKINHIGKILIAAGEWNMPVIAGFCEIENRYVLNRLIYDSPVKKYGYRIIHYDSPDARGVDVGLIYLPALFKPIFSRPVRIIFPFDTTARTRDILYVKGILCSSDTVHLLVNHWPSRRGGVSVSQPKRNYVAYLEKMITDSILKADRNANIIIMGDFNDEPDCESIKILACPPLYNLMEQFRERGTGTHKFAGHWGILDQFIVSESLLDNNGRIGTGIDKVKIFSADFLMKQDEKFMGSAPLRTYTGMKYTAGFSDHLPVVLEIGIRP